MTRRQLISAAAGGAFLQRAGAVNYRDYSRCLPDYLRGLANHGYAKRNAAIAELKTAAAIQERQRWVRETFWNLVGGTPDRTPLNARTVGLRSVTASKTIYESRPGFHISANLHPQHRPAALPRRPFQMGHTTNGKAGDLTALSGL
jgi:hypothetical protein